MTENKEQIQEQEQKVEETTTPEKGSSLANPNEKGEVTINLFDLYKKQEKQIAELNKQITSLMSKQNTSTETTKQKIKL